MKHIQGSYKMRGRKEGKYFFCDKKKGAISLQMALDQQEPGDCHYHQKLVYIRAQLTAEQELYS